jgi:hypothetical protein
LSLCEEDVGRRFNADINYITNNLWENYSNLLILENEWIDKLIDIFKLYESDEHIDEAAILTRTYLDILYQVKRVNSTIKEVIEKIGEIVDATVEGLEGEG